MMDEEKYKMLPDPFFGGECHKPVSLRIENLKTSILRGAYWGRYRGEIQRGEAIAAHIFSEVDDMLVQASVDIRVLKEAGLFGTVSVVCNGVVDGGSAGGWCFQQRLLWNYF